MYVQNRHLGQSEELVTEGPHKSISVPLSSMVSKSSAENLAWFLFLDLGYFMCYFYIMSLFCKSFSNHWANRQFDSVTRNSAITQVQDPGGSGQPLRSLSPQPHQLPGLLSLHAFSAHTAGSSPSLPSAPPPRSWPWPSLPHTLGLPALLLEFCTFYFIIDAINKRKTQKSVFVCMFFNFMKSDQGKRQHDNQAIKFSPGCNNDQQHLSKSFPGMVVMALSLGYWPQGDP